MRWIFLTLLLANVGLLVWQVFETRHAESEVPEGSPPARAASRVYLLDEQGRRSSRDGQLDRVVKSPVVISPGDGGCLAAGPFDEIIRGQDVADQLAALDIDAHLRAVDRQTGESDYRVMIPPASSLQNAFRKLRELKSRNIDSYVITQGPDALAVSLGVFSTKEAAEEARLKSRESGYDVEIATIPRLHREYWIYAAGGGDLEIPEGVWPTIVKQHPGIQRQRLTCSQ